MVLFQQGGPRSGERAGRSVGSPVPARYRAVLAGFLMAATSLMRPWQTGQARRLPVAGGVGKGDGVRLDRDPTLPLEVHGVEDLVAELPVFDRPAALDEPVGERRFAVIDVGDDAEVADMVHGRRSAVPTGR